MLWFARVHELQEALPVAAVVPENLEPQFPCRGAAKALVPAARPASTWCSTSGEPKWPVSRPFLSAGTPPSLQIEVPNDDRCADRVHVAVALPGARDAFLAPEQVLLNRLLLGAVVRHHAEVVAFQIVVGEVFHAGVVRASGRSSHVFDWVWFAQGSASCRKHFRPTPSCRKSQVAIPVSRHCKPVGTACAPDWSCCSTSERGHGRSTRHQRVARPGL